MKKTKILKASEFKKMLLTMTYEEIAKVLGCSSRTIVRLAKKLNMTEKKRRKVIILDDEEFEKLYEEIKDEGVVTNGIELILGGENETKTTNDTTKNKPETQ